jgi:hypothetical protein
MPDARSAREGSLGPFPKPQGTHYGLAVLIIAHWCIVANSTVVPSCARVYPGDSVAKMRPGVVQTGYPGWFEMYTLYTAGRVERIRLGVARSWDLVEWQVPGGGQNGASDPRSANGVWATGRRILATWVMQDCPSGRCARSKSVVDWG